MLSRYLPLILLLALSAKGFSQAETQNPTFPFWKIKGNSGTTSGTNFIGTTDNQALDIRTNDSIRVRVTTAGIIETYNTGRSVFIGEGAGRVDDHTDNDNTFIGYNAGYANTSGWQNIAIGHRALVGNTTGNSCFRLRIKIAFMS